MTVSCPLRLDAREQNNGLDSARIAIPDISYQALDSLIRARDLTGIYLWPSWCAPCRSHVVQFAKIIKAHPDVSFLSINDPDSRAFLAVGLAEQLRGTAGLFRIERHRRQKMVSINDRSEVNYFHRKYAGAGVKQRGIQYFYLLDRAGNLVYAYDDPYFQLDTLSRRLDSVLSGRNM